jgi:hypothetical protein
VATVRVSAAFPGSVHEAETCWYDTSGWDDWVDELARVVSVDGSWPEVGSTVVWESGPAGRGRVTQQVVDYEALGGQTVELEDDAIEGTQWVAFDPLGGEVKVTLILDYRIKRRNPLTPLIDLVFIRRLMAASASRTLTRFGQALAASRHGAGR